MYLAVLPLVAAIVGAIVTKRIIPSLVAALLVGTFIRSHSLVGTFLLAGDYLAKVVSDKDNAFIILFLFSFGALAEIFKVGGGISGFAKRSRPFVKSERDALLSVWAATPVSFLDCCFHVISTTTISKPLIEEVHGSKDKLAFIINTTSSQLVVLIPFATTYVGYILSLITTSMKKTGIAGNPFMVYVSGVFLNFYSIIILLFSVLVIYFDFKALKFKMPQPAFKKDENPEPEGEHDAHEAHQQGDFDEKVPPRIMNLLLPMGFLVATITYMLWVTGHRVSPGFFQAIIHADYERAIFIATLMTLVFTTLLYVLQKVPMKRIESGFLAGGMDLLPPIVILILAWAITSVTQDLGFTSFVGTMIKRSFSPQLIPFAIFLIGGIASYFMGSSWGTWALIMPLAISAAVSAGASLPLTVGAVLAGGSIGDNMSPLGETPVTTAALLKIPITDHIRYILPFGLISITLSTIIYLAAGFVIR